MATLSEIDSFVAAYLSTVQFPDGTTYRSRLHNNGKVEMIIYRDNLYALAKSELLDFTGKVSQVLRYLNNNGITAYLTVENHV